MRDKLDGVEEPDLVVPRNPISPGRDLVDSTAVTSVEIHELNGEGSGPWQDDPDHAKKRIDSFNQAFTHYPSDIERVDFSEEDEGKRKIIRLTVLILGRMMRLLKLHRFGVCARLSDGKTFLIGGPRAPGITLMNDESLSS